MRRVPLLVILFALVAGCDEPRERPVDLPPGPYAQEDEIPDRYQTRGMDRPAVYVIENIDANSVYLIPRDRARVQDRQSQGDPVYEFAIREETFRDLSGKAPIVGAYVELEMGPTGQPERIKVLEQH